MIKYIKQKLAKSVKSKKINVFGLFLLLSFSILVFTKLSQVYTETVTLQLDYTNVPESRVITFDTVPEVKLTISDYGFKLFYYSLISHSIGVDLEQNATIENDTYIWLADDNREQIKDQLGGSTEIISIAPNLVEFPFDTLSVKKIPVKIKSEISFASGYDAIDSIRVIPDSIEIIGPQAKISELEEIYTKTVVLNEVKNPVDQSINLELPENASQLKFSSESVKVSIPVAKFTEGTLDVPVLLNNLPANKQINYFPKTIKVSYYVSLTDYKSIKPNDFKIECDYNEVEQQNQSFFTPKLTINNPQVKTAKMKQDKVEFVITQ
ncbi:CdaR family protein [Sediminibacter sp. Hel_I_10]|uniref:CdaR family protein n=1 Tax=Sediminibacter sp. Hel_I_10 TaxID=1392490 RepID=UPI00056A650B|nr:CdaR family protein [Sediminibacter sp. Hel_I_10]